MHLTTKVHLWVRMFAFTVRRFERESRYFQSEPLLLGIHEIMGARVDQNTTTPQDSRCS